MISKREKNNERELVSKAKSGDRKAFNLLMERHGKMVFNLCIKILNNYDDANDCSQEVFIRAYKSLKNFRQESSFSTWIYRIAVNICKNHLGSSYSKHKKDSFSINMEDEYGKSFIEISDKKYIPEHEAIKNEKKETILNAINSLQEDLRIIILLRDVESHSYDEIAQITSNKLGTVKSKLARARKHLRDELRGKI